MSRKIVTIDGIRYELSEKQQRALQERGFSFTEAFADLGLRANQILGALAAKGLMKLTSKGWQRTALGGRVNKILAKRGGA